ASVTYFFEYPLYHFLSSGRGVERPDVPAHRRQPIFFQRSPKMWIGQAHWRAEIGWNFTDGSFNRFLGHFHFSIESTRNQKVRPPSMSKRMVSENMTFLVNPFDHFGIVLGFFPHGKEGSLDLMVSENLQEISGCHRVRTIIKSQGNTPCR